MRLIRTGVGACVAVTVLAGCGGGGDDGGGGGSGEVVDGGTFRMATSADPGSLDPHASAASNLFQLTHLAYDSLLYTDDQGGVVSGLASDWAVDGQTVTLTLRDDVTCADGSPFTAEDAVANLDYVADPANESPFLGVFLPVGVQSTAEGNTVTMTLAGPAPFVLEGLSGVPMVCAAGLEDRSTLATETQGTGPYELTEAVASDHYTYTLREGYTWGPDGASTDEEGMPDEIVVQVIANETTAANLLLSGDLNASQILGPDAQRLEEAGLFTYDVTAVLGEKWFNHAEGRVTADPVVRMALAQSVDLGQLADVLGAGRGGPGTSFAASGASACAGDSVSDALPEYDPDAAAAALDEAGWTAGSGGVRSKGGTPLSVTFVYDTGLGTPGAAAAELVSAARTELGADVTVTPQDETALVETVFSGGDWDVAWVPLNVSSPDQLVPFLSGPAAPDGNNFASIDNADYTAGVAEATTMVGAEGCDTWLAAEAALVRDADVIPFANQDISFFGSGAEFEVIDVLQPTSIRMTAR